MVVPARLAGPLFGLLLLALRDQARSCALSVTDEMAGLLEALHAVDVACERASDSGHVLDQVGTMEDMKSVSQAAEDVGLSSRQVRRLCACGAVSSRRVGARAYLVGMSSLREYLRGGVAA